MDDPWANAWGDPSRPVLPESTASWTAPSVSVIQGDHEDDLSMPSWSSGPHAGWTEPDLPETSLWGADTIAAGWNPAPSSFDRMSLASKESDAHTEPDLPQEPLHSPVNHEQPKSSETPPPDEGGWKLATNKVDLESPKSSPPSSPVKVAPLSLSPAGGVNDFSTGGWDPAPSLATENSDESLALEKESSPPAKARPLSLVPDDGFGVFETAHEVDDTEGWGSPSRAAFTAPSGDPWATAEPWESEPAAHAQEEAGEDDAWEAARQQKAKQDLHVPPELLASILRQFEDLTLDLWPDKEERDSEPERRVDFESIGLESVVSRLIPQDLTLPQNVPFSKTFSSKQVAEALRLTRHSTCTRSSPMAFYMASKGSSSWEAALKSKPLVPQEDITPAGWKIVAPEKEDNVPTDETKKRPGGGLLSFFQRKSATPSVSEESKQPESASSTGTPRASVDSTRSSTAQSQAVAKSTPSSPSVVSFASSLNPISEITAAKPPTPSPMPDFATESIVHIETPPAASAVSRFLGRFSGRSRSSNPSMALSSDDLEFLADVPTASSGDAISELDTDSLSAMIQSPPLPTKLPAPLAPPPRAPPQPTRALSPPPPPKPQPAQAEDFMSFFDALPPTQSQAPLSAGSPLSLLAPSQPPPVPPPPVPPNRTQSVSSFQAFAAPGPSFSPTSSETRGSSIDQRVPTPKNENADAGSWPSFDYPVAPSPRPPPSKPTTPLQPAKRPFVAVMASSSRPPSASATPPLLPKPGSGFAFPPPPSTQRPATNGSSSFGSSRGPSPFPPPPMSRGQTPLSIQPTPPPQPSVNVDDDDDDFADFLSSPAQTTPPASNAFQSFASAKAAGPILPPPKPMHVTTLSDSFDDFLDPLPPVPPAKNAPSPSFGVSPPALAPPPSVSYHKPPSVSPPPLPAPSASSSSLSQKPSRKADHSRTLSLMESAAARGRWLGPPSPLPEALPPPSLSNNGHAAVDFLGGAFGDTGAGVGVSSMQAAQAAATHVMSNMSASSASLNGSAAGKAPMEAPSWTFPPPAGFNAGLPPPPAASPFASGASLKPVNSNANGKSLPFTFSSTSPPAASASTNASKGSESGKPGGLSAQDLSFFEGL